MRSDVIVVGGGVIGLAVARRLAPGRSVLLLDRQAPGREASWAAAGMLAPHSEAHRDDAFLRLGLASLRLYRAFTEDLRQETGIDAGYRDEGTLVLATTAAELEELERRGAWQRSAGLDPRLLTPREVRELEPRLTLDLAGALFCPADHQVRPRALLQALERACSIRGVRVLEGSAVDQVLLRNGAVTGVAAGEHRFEAPVVVLAAGAWTGAIRGLQPAVATTPRKGQILALRMPSPLLRHVVRWGSRYLVPRRDGELVVGATDEDRGFDRTLTAAAVGGLLQDAARMVEALGALEIRETWTGLRPMIPGGAPLIGAAAPAGLFYALGHYRNGILLAPITAQLVADQVLVAASDSFPEFSPRRLEPVPRAAGEI